MSMERMPGANSPELLPVSPESDFDFGLEEFDFDAAFQSALSDVVSDEELALNEKVSRMETILNEGNSEVYRDFVDMRAMAAQIEMFCNHDHSLNEALAGNETVNSLLNEHANDGHDHDEQDEDDKKNKKKKRKKRWLR